MIWNLENKVTHKVDTWYSNDIVKKIKEIATDIIEKDCYENSDIKAQKILNIIEESEKECTNVHISE